MTLQETIKSSIDAGAVRFQELGLSREAAYLFSYTTSKLAFVMTAYMLLSDSTKISEKESSDFSL